MARAWDRIDRGSVDGAHRTSFPNVGSITTPSRIRYTVNASSVPRSLDSIHLSIIVVIVVAHARLTRQRGIDAFTASGDESETPDAELVSDESADEGTRFGFEDVNLAVGHADDDVIVVDRERCYDAVIGRGMGGK